MGAPPREREGIVLRESRQSKRGNNRIVFCGVMRGRELFMELNSREVRVLQA